MKFLNFFKKQIFKEIGVLLAFLLLLLLLNWRLFAIGSENQLFLYGDNLSTLNNLFYIFSHFNIWHPFSTLIGQNGMLGSYPMAEPQNSIFYLPITLAFVIFKVLNFGPVGLYYELLFLHTAHFLVGVFFIYKISNKVLTISRPLSFVAGVVYLGLGWNAAWFGTSTLSYMVGILPLVFYIFFRYLQTKTFRTYILFVLSLALFLYAGGIVNFFSYLLLNLFLLLTAFVFLKYDQFFSYKSKKEVIKQYTLIFIVAPILSLLAYSVQLFTTYQISDDIVHSSSSYDYLAFFGTHFYDIIGVIVPKFGLLGFGSSTVPQFVSLNSLYVGFLALIIVIFGILIVKKKNILLFASLIVINAILSLGGAFPLYDAAYFFPGNSFFRGNEKYLVFMGIYFSLIIPLVLLYIQRKEFDFEAAKKMGRYVANYFFVLIIFAFVSSFAVFALLVFQREDPNFSTIYYRVALTFSNYFWWMFFIGIISFFTLKFFIRHSRGVAIIALIFVLFIDTSVNFKYGLYYSTTIQDLVSKTFFQNIEGKTVINDIDKYSQLYHIPEIIGVNPTFFYSAIPNRYLLEYDGQMKAPPNIFRSELMKAAGIDGIITTNIINDTNFQLESTNEINSGNYKQLYVYNANGDIHNDWGSHPSFEIGDIRYYSLSRTKKAFFTTNYSKEAKDQDVLTDLTKKDFVATEPVLLTNEVSASNQETVKYVSDVSFIADEPTYKKINLNNKINAGLFYFNIPYSSIWKARVNGVDTKIYRANYAFSAVKINGADAVVEIYTDTSKNVIFLYVSISLILLLTASLIVPRKQLLLLTKKKDI